MDRSERVDLIVLGAGIVGAAVARDAARRGLATMLVDTHDIGSGTTSASTRLIHGGLRYLEHFDIRLVRESLRERDLLLKNAPHLVRPQSFLLPIYADSRRSPSVIRAGLTLYRALSPRSNLPPSRFFNTEETLVREPGLRRAGLRFAAEYWDAQCTFPERLALETALDARDHGALIFTHAGDLSLLRGSSGIRGVSFTHRGGSTEATAPVVVNATGPWVDHLLPAGRSETLIRGSRGSHIVVDAPACGPSRAVYAEASDGRPFFVVPWNGSLLVGTTDVFHDSGDEPPCPTDWEIDYLLSSLDRLLPGMGSESVRFQYWFSGVRPLASGKSETPGSVSRRYRIVVHDGALRGLVTVAGGKLTVHRAIGQEVVKLVARRAGRPIPPSDTMNAPLPGSLRLTQEDERAIGGDVMNRLRDVYGGAFAQILSLGDARPVLLRRLATAGDALAAEVVYAVESEVAASLEDILLRRTMLGLRPDFGLGCLDEIAQIVIDECGWPAAQVRVEVAAYRRRAATRRTFATT